MFEVEFYDEKIVEEFNALPPKLRAKMTRLIQLLAQGGHLTREKFVKALGDGLFELRASAFEGIARAFYTYKNGKIIIILKVFIKKTQKTPKNELEQARKILAKIKEQK